MSLIIPGQNGGAADIGSTVLAYDANLQAFVTAFTLPTADGTVGQVLMTDGAGNITFVSPAAGTFISVGLSVPTGFAVSGSPVTGSGTLALAFDTGYSLPTTASQTNWDTAFGWGNHASAGYLLSSTAASTYQPLDADLTAIAALAGTSGLLRKTAADTWSLDAATYLQSGAIGSTVLAYDANLQAFVTAFTLPTADGTSGQVLTTNGAGVISFATPSGGGSPTSPEIITTPTGTVYRFTQDTAPTERGPGVPLVDGDIWYDPSTRKRWIRKGIYWLSERTYIYKWAINTSTVSGNGTPTGEPVEFASTVDPLIWFEGFSMAGVYNSPQDADNYRTLNLIAIAAPNTTLDSFNTIGKSGSYFAQYKEVGVAAAARRVSLTIISTGSPGSLTLWNAFAFYKEIYA